jgi:hypothetical protein
MAARGSHCRRSGTDTGGGTGASAEAPRTPGQRLLPWTADTGAAIPGRLLTGADTNPQVSVGFSMEQPGPRRLSCPCDIPGGPGEAGHEWGADAGIHRI